MEGITMKLFQYVDKKNATWFKTKISEFCNRLVQREKGDVEKLNKLNRTTLVKDFTKSVEASLPYRISSQYINSTLFKTQLKWEIDYKIGRTIVKYHHPFHLKASELQKWTIEGTGLKYKCKENYYRERYGEENWEYIMKNEEE